MRTAVAVFFVCLLPGCAAPRAYDAPEGRQVLLDVPFFPDGTDQCGPSALASVLAYLGKPEPPSTLRKEIYRADLKGSLTVDLLLAAQGRGLTVEVAEGGMAQLKWQLEQGRPLIAFVDVGFRFYPIGHFLVVTGYDDQRRVLYAHSGLKRDLQISYRKFDRQWEKTKRWALLILPVQS